MVNEGSNEKFGKVFMALKILKITDGKSGHISVSNGVIEAIKKNNEIEVIEEKVKIRLKLFLLILKFILKHDLFSSKLILNDLLIRFFYKNYHKPDSKIDLIISSGGDTLFLNVWLGKALNTKNIFCSSLRGIDPKYFSLVVSVFEPNLKNSIKMEIAPTQIGSKDLPQRVEKFCNEKNIDKNQKYFVLLIGGDGEGHIYAEDDYRTLASSFMAIAKRYKAKVLITTSRRTGQKNEKLLKELFADYKDDIAYSVYFGENPERVVQIYLELGSVIFVTEESESMITESLCFKKPVFALYPKKVQKGKKYEKYENYLCRLSSNKRIVRLEIDHNLSNVNLDEFDFKYIEKLPIDYLAEKIQPYLK